MDDRSGLLDRNAAATERLRALVARLAPPDLGCALGGGWTVAFALCHLAFWDARAVRAAEAVDAQLAALPPARRDALLAG